MIARIMRAFRPLDTSHVDAAIACASTQYRGVQVRARALRRDVSCDGAAAVMGRFSDQVRAFAGHLLRDIYDGTTSEQVPPEMTALVHRIK